MTANAASWSFRYNVCQFSDSDRPSNDLYPRIGVTPSVYPVDDGGYLMKVYIAEKPSLGKGIAAHHPAVAEGLKYH